MRTAIGIELGARTVRVVAINDDANRVVIARADRSGTEGVLAKIAQAAVREVLKSVGGAPPPAAICAHNADDDGVRAAAASIGNLLTVTGPINSAGLSAAIAESWAGAGRGVRNLVALLIGDDISAGILIDGHPLKGAHGRAGSAAWLALNPVERQDYRRSGCLDAEVSSRGVARRLIWRIEAGDRSAVLDRAGHPEAITADHVYEGARSGDGVAVSVVRDTAKYIGMAVGNLAITLDPDLVVLGGEISRAGDLLLDPVRQECARRLPPSLAETVRIEMSPLGEHAAAIGAARLALT